IDRGPKRQEEQENQKNSVHCGLAQQGRREKQTQHGALTKMLYRYCYGVTIEAEERRALPVS
ncbi:MAG: hypothetical protein ABW206_08370, partial [Agrobacterium vaccinii]